MSFDHNVNTHSDHRQPEDNHSGHSGRNQESSTPSTSQDGGRLMPVFNRRLSESTRPLRLPPIQLPPDVDFNKKQNQSRFSTCPSLHQHKSGKAPSPTTEKMLRQFFARSDDISTGFAYVAPSHAVGPVGGRLPDSVHSSRNQPSQTSESHYRRSSISHSQQTLQPILGHSGAHGQSSFITATPPNMYPICGGGSTRIEEPNHVGGRFLSNPLQSGSSTAPNPSLAESSSNANSFGVGNTEEGELYRCRDCNRKCKSKASYLKHRSMMCTHRLGALTLECRYCKRHYTYAGYLQRHELECAKTLS